MPARPVRLARLNALAALADADLGRSEEDLKMRFAVPLLEALGHTRLRFEHKGKDILLRDGLPRGSAVVVEAKRPDVGLDAHLAQLERYALEERALLAVLTNGRRLRIYAPFWNQAKSFAEALLWDFARADLANDRHLASLTSVLSHEALATKWAQAAILNRQASIEGVWHAADGIRQQIRERRAQLEQRLADIERQAARLDAERAAAQDELVQLPARERDKIHGLFAIGCVPLVPSGEFGDVLPPPSRPAAAPARPVESRGWTPERLYQRASAKQRRVFAAFVRLGRRTAGVRELAEASGLHAHTIAACLSSYRNLSTKWGFAPLIEFERVPADERERRGNRYAIAAAWWPLIRKLYARARKPTADSR